MDIMKSQKTISREEVKQRLIKAGYTTKVPRKIYDYRNEEEWEDKYFPPSENQIININYLNMSYMNIYSVELLEDILLVTYYDASEYEVPISIPYSKLFSIEIAVYRGSS